MADSMCKGLERQRQESGRVEQRYKDFSDTCWWEVEPDVGRVADGIPRRVDRLRCLGNAIVPQVAYEILKLMRVE